MLIIFYRKKARERIHGKKYLIYGTMMFVMDKATFSSHKPLNTAQHNFRVFFESLTCDLYSNATERLVDSL